MELLPGSAFSRRLETNGIIVSTCDTCFVAVALSLREAELENAEREHACDPETLDHWKLFLGEIQRPGPIRIRALQS